jgi:hypothetical protein
MGCIKALSISTHTVFWANVFQHTAAQTTSNRGDEGFNGFRDSCDRSMSTIYGQSIENAAAEEMGKVSWNEVSHKESSVRCGRLDGELESSPCRTWALFVSSFRVKD